MSSSAAAAVFSLLLAIPLLAQHEHGGSANERLGSVAFSTSCSVDARPLFNRAVALLHSFEFARAIEGFSATVAADPSCAMAEWGIALSRWGNPFATGLRPPPPLQQGRDAVNRAKTIGAKTAREGAYIEAVSQLYTSFETIDQTTRVLAYRDAMAGVAAANPNDTEAPIFHALAIAVAAPPTDKTYADLLKAGAMLESSSPPSRITRECRTTSSTAMTSRRSRIGRWGPRGATRRSPRRRQVRRRVCARRDSRAIRARARGMGRRREARAAAEPVSVRRRPDVLRKSAWRGAHGRRGGHARRDMLKTIKDRLTEAREVYWADQTEIQRRSASAWLAFVEGRRTDALADMRAAAALEDGTEKSVMTPGPLAPKRELVGEMLLQMDRPAEALKEFEATLEKEPNRFRALFGAARAASLAGDRQKARTYSGSLLKICERADKPGRPELVEATRWARSSP